MLNLTPHAISLISPVTGEAVIFPPSGTVARVSSEETRVDVLTISPSVTLPVIHRSFGEVTGLPPEGTPCLVSALVLSACPGRAGVFAPDTGPTAVRNESGQVIGVTRLVRA